jgi:hypothetical protein
MTWFPTAPTRLLFYVPKDMIIIIGYTHQRRCCRAVAPTFYNVTLLVAGAQTLFVARIWNRPKSPWKHIVGVVANTFLTCAIARWIAGDSGREYEAKRQVTFGAGKRWTLPQHGNNVLHAVQVREGVACTLTSLTMAACVQKQLLVIFAV